MFLVLLTTATEASKYTSANRGIFGVFLLQIVGFLILLLVGTVATNGYVEAESKTQTESKVWSNARSDYS